MKTILVVEDNDVNREMARTYLEGWGFEVVDRADGAAALEYIKGSPPDLVLLDIQMPVMDGYEVVRRLRQDPQCAQLPVIALTAYAMNGDSERALEAGFDSYQTKPINSKALRAEIESLLGPRRANGRQA